MEYLIQVKNLSKKFCRNFRYSLRYAVADIINELLGKRKSVALRKNEFLAIDDISFSLKRGEALAILGPNGAGKSTILKLLTGILKPETGTITINGKVCALIQLSAGFNPLLTGRENIYIKSAMFGMTKNDTNLIINQIIDFAELRQSIDSPIQSYSSGMVARLGFSIAIFSSPDILILDEILAVGDMAFRYKCYQKIKEIIPKTAVIFISHNIQSILEICNHAIIINHGKISTFHHDINDAILTYLNKFNKLPNKIETNNSITVNNITINDSYAPIITLEYKSAFKLSLNLLAPDKQYLLRLNFSKLSSEIIATTEKYVTCQNSEIFIDSLQVANNYTYLSIELIDFDQNIVYSNKNFCLVTITNSPISSSPYFINSK
ncbi:MAG: ABC transporter ATP-binding protein [Lentisphaeria bacterium]